MISPQNQPWSSHGLLHFSPKNFINSVPCFGTDQTAPHGLKQPKHQQNTKNRNKTQVGRNPTSRSLKKLPKSGTHAKPSPRRAFLLLVPKPADGRIRRIFREKFLSLRKKNTKMATGLPILHSTFFVLLLTLEKKHCSIFSSFSDLTTPK